MVAHRLSRMILWLIGVTVHADGIRGQSTTISSGVNAMC